MRSKLTILSTLVTLVTLFSGFNAQAGIREDISGHAWCGWSLDREKNFREDFSSSNGRFDFYVNGYFETGWNMGFVISEDGTVTLDFGNGRKPSHKVVKIENVQVKDITVAKATLANNSYMYQCDKKPWVFPVPGKDPIIVR